MSDLPDAVVERIAVEVAKATGLTLGTIAAINLPAVTVTVTMGGVSSAGCRVLAGYYPTVGDLVIVERILGRWVVQGKFSTNLTKPTTTDTQPPDPTPVPVPVSGSITVAPAGNRFGFRDMSGSTWDWSRTRSGLAQGKSVMSFYGLPDYITIEASLVWPSTITLPPGATVTSAKVAFTRTDSGGASLVSPVIYGHTLTSGATPSGPAVNYLHASYGPWRPGTLGLGQSGTWDLPSGWIAALLAGTIKGLAVRSESYADNAYFTPASTTLTITYTYTP